MFFFFCLLTRLLSLKMAFTGYKFHEYFCVEGINDIHRKYCKNMPIHNISMAVLSVQGTQMEHKIKGPQRVNAG